jgi:CMP-2-keto-3-deoxyoctulosonic acid synthetase
LKYRYMRAVDTQDWDLLATVFTANARTWYSSGTLSASGRENIVAMLSGAMRPSIYSSHIALHPEITLTSATTAKGSWRFEDIVHFSEPDPALVVAGIQGGERLIGAGYYYDEYEKENDQWKIASTGYVRLFEATEQVREPSSLKLRGEKARGRVGK